MQQASSTANHKKRLLVTASTFPRWANDTEPRFVYDLCMQLKKHYNVTALVPAAPGAKSQEWMDGILVKRFRYFPIAKLQTLAYPGAIVPRIKEQPARALLVPFFFVAEYFAIHREMKRNDAALVNWFVPQGIAQTFASKKPYVITGHGGDVTSLNGFPFHALKQRVIDRAGAVTVVSTDLKKSLTSHYRHAESASVIPMGVDLTFFSPKYRNEDVRRTISPDGKPIVLFVARLAEKKGTRFLLRAMKGIDAKLIIAGDGPERSMLEKLATDLSIDCTFLGAQSRDELRPLFASCDVYVAPSVVASDGDKDGLPVAILEAMASGAPIVASNIAGIPTAVADGENGFLTEPEDVSAIHNAITQILNDSALHARFSQASVSRSKKFDFSAIGDEYVELIDSLI